MALTKSPDAISLPEAPFKPGSLRDREYHQYRRTQEGPAVAVVGQDGEGVARELNVILEELLQETRKVRFGLELLLEQEIEDPQALAD